jgi:hypothetical protein
MMPDTTLYSLFMPPEDHFGDFGLICGFTATSQVLDQIRRTFTGEMSRPVLAAFIHPTVNAISDVAGLAWMWMRLRDRGYNLLHAKVALLGFRQRGGEGYTIRLAVSTGNWTQDPLTGSIDMFWSIDVAADQAGAEDIADLRAAWQMFDWLRERADCGLITRKYDGLYPDAMLAAAINALPASTATPRFIDSRNQALFPQVVARIGSRKRADSLILGSGYFEVDGDGSAGLPERLRRALVQEKLLRKDASLDLFLNPQSCQGLVARAAALTDAGWNLRRPFSALHGDEGRLHAKFAVLASGEREAVGRVYLGSGNLSRNGFETAAQAGGNLEAGVVVDFPAGLKWRNRKGSRDGVSSVLPVQFNETVALTALQAGDGFVQPEEPATLPAVSWFLWQDGVLSAPGDLAIGVVAPDGTAALTPFAWPAPAPAIAVLTDGGWRLPVIADGVLVSQRAAAMGGEDVLALLAAFPEPADLDQPEDGFEDEDAMADPTDATPARPATYAIRRMMELLVRLGEAQARLDPRDWPRWCRELRQSLCAITDHEQAMIGFFRGAMVNPLPILTDRRMCPAGVETALMTQALAEIAENWELGDCPSLWTGEAA